MIEKLISLLGESIESAKIKALLMAWNVPYPSKITCTADNPTLKGKVEKDCVRLYFGRGGNSRYLKPQPAPWESNYFAIFTLIEFTKKRKGGIPFDVEFSMTPDELTVILGEPVVDSMGTTTTWRKNVSDQHELIVSDLLSEGAEEPLRSMNLTFIYEQDLLTMEDYEKAGF